MPDDNTLERTRKFIRGGSGCDCEECETARKNLLRAVRQEALEEAMSLVYGHTDHGEFVHGGRYECADAIYKEIRALINSEGRDA